MDLTALQDVANALWPLFAAGAAGRAGEAGTNQALRGAESLLGRIRAERRARGLAEDPSSRSELLEELRQLQESDPSAFASMQVVVSNFFAPVDASSANFGIQQKL